MKQENSIKEVAKELGVTVKEGDYSFNRQLLAGRINELITGDFQRLISILYRMDISEPKLKLLLKENPGHDAGVIIADLMIERQAQKIKSRQETRSDREIPDDEKW